ATSGMIRESMIPFGFLAGGILADKVFTPGMMSDGVLAPLFGGLVGTGDGAGIGLMFLCTALLGASLAFGAYFIPALRNVEDDLPDVPEVEAA
ncbi:MAG: MFS transporter, partial [Aggregatilineales bacterium]